MAKLAFLPQTVYVENYGVMRFHRIFSYHASHLNFFTERTVGEYIVNDDVVRYRIMSLKETYVRVRAL